MDATKRPFLTPLKLVEFEGHIKVAQADGSWLFEMSRAKAEYFVTAVNNFDEMVEALIHLKEELVQFHGNVHGKCTDQGPTTCPTWEAIHKARALLAKVKEG